MINIMLVNNSGSGLAGYREISSGTSVGSLFTSEIGGNTDNYLIRVNREQVSMDYVLQEGDRVTFTPTKIEGA